jgi:hypothetical protein
MQAADGEPTQVFYEQTMLLARCTYDKIMNTNNNSIRYSDGNLPMDALLDSGNSLFHFADYSCALTVSLENADLTQEATYLRDVPLFITFWTSKVEALPISTDWKYTIRVYHEHATLIRILKRCGCSNSSDRERGSYTSIVEVIDSLGNSLKENLSQGHVIRICQDASGECALQRAAAFFEHQSESHYADRQILERSQIDAETLKKSVLMEFGEIVFDDQTVSSHNSRNSSKDLKFVLDQLYKCSPGNAGFCKKFGRLDFTAFAKLASPNVAESATGFTRSGDFEHL